MQNIHEAVEGVLETRLGFVLGEERDASGRPVQLFEAYGHPRSLPAGAWERLIDIDFGSRSRRA
jgi:hypothetical protein